MLQLLCYYGTACSKLFCSIHYKTCEPCSIYKASFPLAHCERWMPINMYIAGVPTFNPGITHTEA